MVTLGGEELTVSVSGGTVSFTAANGGTVATVVTPDVMSCKGVVHIVSEVLIPGADEPVDEVETPAEEPADEPPVDEPVVETPAEEPAGDEPDGETPGDETPGDEPSDDESGGDTPAEEPAGDEPDGETPGDDTPAVDAPVPDDCGSIFDIIVSTGELGNLETVVLVRCLRLY